MDVKRYTKEEKRYLIDLSQDEAKEFAIAMSYCINYGSSANAISFASKMLSELAKVEAK